MNIEEKLKQELQTAITHPDVLSLAIDALIAGLGAGYCEYTENPALRLLAVKYLCPFCGKLHRSKLHDKLSELYSDDAAYNAAFKKAQANRPDSIYLMYQEIAIQHPGFPMELFDNPQEYVP